MTVSALNKNKVLWSWQIEKVSQTLISVDFRRFLVSLCLFTFYKFLILLFQVKTKSPSSITSPGKDYGISQRIEDIREKLIAGYDRWQLARSNGAQIVEAIHNAKEKARTSGSSAYPPELENYCSKLKVARTVMSEVKLDTDNFLKEIKRSISIIKSTNDNDELEAKLLEVAEVISRVSDSYESELKVKSQVLGKQNSIYSQEMFIKVSLQNTSLTPCHQMNLKFS